MLKMIVLHWLNPTLVKVSNPGHPYGIPSAVTLKSKYNPISDGRAISSSPLTNMNLSHPLLT